jgi:hypothetical protein
MRPLLPLVVAACLAWLSAPLSANAADAWRATQVAGDVRIEVAGTAPVPLTVAMTIPSDALIETASSGSATLMRGDDSVVVAPNSRLRLPADDAKGFTRIIEEFGQLFFQVGKKTAPHFRVETPLLAATVKGTAFVVSVDSKSTNVQVREGLVLVENAASADATYVAAGRSARVAISQPMDLYLDNSVVPPAALRLGEAREWHELSGNDQAVPAIPKRDRSAKANTDPSGAAQIMLTAASGEARRRPASVVLDSTLSGIGLGILAAALAIIFIGTSRRPPGLVEIKAKRAADSEQTPS